MALLIFQQSSTKQYLHFQTITFCFRMPALLSRHAQADCPHLCQTQRETLNRTKPPVHCHPPRRISLLFSGIYSLPLCCSNTQAFNPTQVLSVYCLYEVYEATLRYLQLRMAFHDPRERDIMKIIAPKLQQQHRDPWNAVGY